MMPIIVLRGLQGYCALEVQAVLGNSEVVIRNIGSQASSVKGIAGATVMPDVGTVLIINPLLLLTNKQSLLNNKSKFLPQIQSDLKVMVVDDSLTVRRVSQRMLERSGYAVMLARDGFDAVEILKSELPFVILLDIEMPRMDGFEFLRQLRQDVKTSHIPVVMITSRTAARHRERAAELGATAYLGKPFNETELLKLLKNFSGKYKTHDAVSVANIAD